MNRPQGRNAQQAKTGIEADAANAGDRNVPGLAARKAAAKLLAIVIDAKTPLDGLTDNDNGHPHYLALDMRDRSLVRAILTTALRFRVTIGKLLSRRLERPLPPNATALSHILHVAAAQILFLDIPDSAAVDLAVTHAKSDPRTARFAGSRQRRAAVARAWEGRRTPAYARDHARRAGLVRRAADGRLRQGQGGGDPCRAPGRGAGRFHCEVDPGTVGRALRRHRTADRRRAGRKTRRERLRPAWFRRGRVVGAGCGGDPARAAHGDVAGKRVADLCAAPGGKTAQLVLAGAEVTAIDASKNRLVRLARNLERLRLEAKIVQADILTYQPDELFDAILLDAPCSSTGTVRRHPDVPWTKSLADIEKLAALQTRMLEAAVEAGEARRPRRLLQLLARSGRGRGALPRFPGRNR